MQIQGVLIIHKLQIVLLSMKIKRDILNHIKIHIIIKRMMELNIILQSNRSITLLLIQTSILYSFYKTQHHHHLHKTSIITLVLKVVVQEIIKQVVKDQ